MINRDLDRLNQIIHSIQRIKTILSDKTKEEFLKSEDLQELIAFNLMNIGENAGKISDIVKTDNSNIPWRQISALRNIIVHDYISFQQKIIWNTVQKDILNLEKDILLAISNYKIPKS